MSCIVQCAASSVLVIRIVGVASSLYYSASLRTTMGKGWVPEGPDLAQGEGFGQALRLHFLLGQLPRSCAQHGGTQQAPLHTHIAVCGFCYGKGQDAPLDGCRVHVLHCCHCYFCPAVQHLHRKQDKVSKSDQQLSARHTWCKQLKKVWEKSSQC